MKRYAYTIGYAHHSQESFYELLKQYGIQLVIDVRTMAYSRYHPQFNKEPLKHFLNEQGILYRQMQEAFGIVRPDSLLLNKEGYLDLTQIAKQPECEKAIDQMIRGIEEGYHIAFMCAEKSPLDCHRSTLVARVLYERGYSIAHILHDGSIQTQGQIEKELMDKYYPERRQLQLFEIDEHDLLDRAYELQSNKIIATNGKRVLKENYHGPNKK